MPRCCRYASPRLPGRAAWNAASCWARSGRAGAGARGAGGCATAWLTGRCGALPLCPLLARWRPWKGRLALLLLAPLRPRRFHIAPGPAGKAHETATVHLHAQAALAVGAVEGAERPQHMTAFADDGAAGGKVRRGKREVVTRRVTGNAHGLDSSRIVPRSGRKITPTLPVSPCRFFATVSSTARAGRVAIRSCASVRNTTTSAAYSRSPLSLSESSAALPLPLP